MKKKLLLICLISLIGCENSSSSLETYTITYHLNGGTGAEDSTYSSETLNIILPVPQKEHFDFEGWFINEQFLGEPITAILKGSIGNKEFWAKWELQTFDDTNEYDLTYHYSSFGKYPQTVVSNQSLITQLKKISVTNDLGYIEYENEQYVKVKATPWEAVNDVVFSNGAVIKEGSTYYFKVEPIKWRILKQTNNEYQLLSEYILTKSRFDAYSPIYETSDVREYLINTFYNQSFDLNEQDNLQLTNLNDANVNDKVYLLSKDNYVDIASGFENDTIVYSKTRIGRLTDYAKTIGTYSNEWYPITGVGSQLTRSFYSIPSEMFYVVGYNGSVHYTGGIADVENGVRPAITIKTQ
jgi:hypothetical protein